MGTREAIEVSRSEGASTCCLHFKGPLNERFDPGDTTDLPPSVAIDLAEVNLITSAGVSRWTTFLEQLQRDRRVYLLRCSPAVINQINLVVNFLGSAEVLSFLVPYLCTRCLLEREILVDTLRHRNLLRSGAVPPALCPDCGVPLTFEDPEYCRFIGRSAGASPDRATSTLLEKLGLSFGPPPNARTLEIAKLIEGKVTLMRLAGEIDERFRPRRMVSGLEGAVALVLTDLVVARSGRPAWNDLLGELCQRATPLVLVDVPTPLVDLLSEDTVQLKEASVYSIVAPCFCPTCSDVVSRSVPISALRHGERAVATCSRCGHRVDLVVGSVSYAWLVERFRPTPRAIKEVIARASALFSSAGVEAHLHSEGDKAPPSRDRIGGYQILRLLSEGGMAQIFLAKRESIGGFEKPVALKIFRRELLDVARDSVQMFLSEAKLCANLNHPNIVQIFDVGVEGGDLYIAMEYVDGQDLRKLRKLSALAMPAPFVGTVLIHIATALHSAHNTQDLAGKPLCIVHRDVSPQNVLVGIDGQVKLIDFGIALAGRELTKQRKNVAGNVCYMSPEQCRGQPLDGRSDIFSLGIVLFELLTGRRLFRRGNTDDTMSAILASEIPPLPASLRSFEPIVRRALERDPNRRFDTALEFAERLRETLAASGGLLNQAELSAFVKRLLATPSGAATENAVSMLAPQPVSSQGLTVAAKPATRRSRPPLWMIPIVIALVAAIVLFAKTC